MDILRDPVWQGIAALIAIAGAIAGIILALFPELRHVFRKWLAENSRTIVLVVVALAMGILVGVLFSGSVRTSQAPTPVVVEVTRIATPTPAPSLTPIATDTSTPTPTNTPTLSPVVIIDTMDSTSGWSIFSDPESSIVISSIPGVEGNAIEISYTLKAGGWVGISKQINPETLLGTMGISFFRSGSGASNTIELKLLYAPDPSGQSTTFEHLWPTDTVGGWMSRKVVYSEYCEFACLDLGKVRKIDFAISSREGGIPGSGIVVIDHVVGIR